MTNQKKGGSTCALATGRLEIRESVQVLFKQQKTPTGSRPGKGDLTSSLWPQAGGFFVLLLTIQD